MKAVKAFLLPGAICIAIVYFSYHALAGEQGLASWSQLQAEQDKLVAQLDGLKAEKARLQVQLGRLRDATLDLDYVEELARTKMSYARRDELLVAVR
jgi:cell division protein FtsB